MQYHITLDFVNYRQYTGNIERKLTDFIFESEFGEEWTVPEKWDTRLLEFATEHDEYALISLCETEDKVYSEEEVKKYGLETEVNDGSTKNYHCFRVSWRFELPSENEAIDMAEFLVKKSQKFMMTKPGEFESRKQFKKKLEIPYEVYRLEKLLVAKKE